MCVPYPLAQPLLSTSATWRHHDVISAKAQGGNMGTFSILFRMVLRSTPPIFSFLLIFSNLFPISTGLLWNLGHTFSTVFPHPEAWSLFYQQSMTYTCTSSELCISYRRILRDYEISVRVLNWCPFNSPNFISPNAGVFPIRRISIRRIPNRRIPFRRIPILLFGLGLGIGLVLG